MTRSSGDEAVRPSFTPDSTRATLDAACERVALDSADAELLRLGENALYRLRSAPVVVRIARDLAYLGDADKEVGVADWLASIDFAAVRLHDVKGQPLDVEGHPVTFWRYFDGERGGPANVGDLGILLRKLHETAAPAGLSLPPDNVLGRVSRRIESAPVPDSDKSFLLERCEELSARIRELRFPLAPTVIHGDAHVQNLMVRGSDVILIDFERFARGQPEWDLSVTATEYVTAGWWTPAQYVQFESAYGYDVTKWEGFPLLRATQEIKMTTWIMQNVRQSTEIAAEYELRMQDIRTGQGGHWTPF